MSSLLHLYWKIWCPFVFMKMSDVLCIGNRLWNKELEIYSQLLKSCVTSWVGDTFQTPLQEPLCTHYNTHIVTILPCILSLTEQQQHRCTYWGSYLDSLCGISLGLCIMSAWVVYTQGLQMWQLAQADRQLNLRIILEWNIQGLQCLWCKRLPERHVLRL